MPKNIKILEKMCVFVPEVAFCQNKEGITELAKSFQSVCVDIEKTVKQWNLLHRLAKRDKASDEFWDKVNESVNVRGEKRFEQNSKLAPVLFCLPLSKATVEGAFSIVNTIKDKLKNRMAMKNADAILQIRYLLPITCADVEPTAWMYQKFNSEVMYQGEFDNNFLGALGRME